MSSKETDWAPPPRIYHLTEAERDAYSWDREMRRQSQPRLRQPIQVEPGTVCKLCPEPIKDGQLTFPESSVGLVHADCHFLYACERWKIGVR